MDTAVNYLSTLSISALKCLAFSLDHGVRGELCLAYDCSHDHANCTGFPNEACKQVQEWCKGAVELECPTVKMQECFAGHVFFSIITSLDQSLLQKHKEHIKHLRLETANYMMEEESYDLLYNLVPKNTDTALETVAVVMTVRKGELSNLPEAGKAAGDIQLHTVSRLITELKRKGVAVTLEVIITSPSVDDCCKLYGIPEDRPLCQHITTLNINGDCPTELSIFKSGKSLSAYPTAFFISKFSTMQHLQLNISKFSDKLLYALAQREEGTLSLPLRTLTVFKDRNVLSCNVPDVSAKAWHTLQRVYPLLQVSCNIKRAKHNILLKVLKRGVPLVNLSVKETSFKLQNNLIITCKEFSETLQFFTCCTKTRIPVGLFEVLVTDRYLMTRCIHSKRGSDLTITVF